WTNKVEASCLLSVAILLRQLSMAAWNCSKEANQVEFNDCLRTNRHRRSMRLRFGEYEGKNSNAMPSSRASACTSSQLVAGVVQGHGDQHPQPRRRQGPQQRADRLGRDVPLGARRRFSPSTLCPFPKCLPL